MKITTKNILAHDPKLIQKIQELAELCKFKNIRLFTGFSPYQREGFNLLVNLKDETTTDEYLGIFIGGLKVLLNGARVDVIIEDRLNDLYRNIIRESEYSETLNEENLGNYGDIIVDTEKNSEAMQYLEKNYSLSQISTILNARQLYEKTEEQKTSEQKFCS